MRDVLIGVAVGGLLVSVVLQARPRPASDDVPATFVADPEPTVGRYQIVNGTPGFAANIMLLDTISGDTWVTCSSPETSNQWCRVQRTEGQTDPKR